MKKCPQCETVKNLTEFYKNRRRKDGHQPHCKACQAEQQRRWYGRNKERQNATDRAWREANAEHNAEYQRKYRKDNAARRRVDAQRRRAMELDAMVPGYAEPVTEMLVKFYGRPCIAPGCKADKPTLDHIIPLDRGGKHTYENAQPLCQSHNSTKGRWHSTDYRLHANIGNSKEGITLINITRLAGRG